MAKSQWRALTQLKIAALMPWCRESLFRCDPYLVWADATAELDAKPEREAMPVLSIAVLVELAAAGDVDGFLKRFNKDADGLEQLRFLPNGFEPYPPSRFVTGLVARSGLAALVTEVLDQKIERFTLQNSRVDIARATQTSRVTRTVCAAPEEAPPRNKPLPGTYLGIIDNGLPVLRLRDAIQLLGHPAHFWDQGWQPPHLTGTETSIGAPEADDLYWQVGWESRFSMNGDISVQDPPRGFRYGRRLKRLGADAARKMTETSIS